MANLDPKTILSEDEATRLWHRAAELQAEAAQRLEERSRELAPRSGDGDTDPTDGYALEHVKTAAVDAGISSEFVDYAVAELRNERHLAQKMPNVIDRAADRFLGNPAKSAEVSRVIPASAERVFQAMQRVFPADPYKLVLRDTQGGDLLGGGVLVFEVPAWSGLETSSLAYQVRGWADIRQIYVTLTPLDTDPTSCEVTIRAPLRHSRRVNLLVIGAMSGLTGGGAAVAGIGIGLVAASAIGATALLGAGLIAMTALGLGGVVGGGTVLAYRPFYRYALGRGLKALEDLLAALDVGIRTGWSFTSPSPEAVRLPAGQSWPGSQPPSPDSEPR